MARFMKKISVDGEFYDFKKSGVYAYIPNELKKYCVPIDKVKLWKDNPRKNEDAAEKLTELITLNGFRVPIIVDQWSIIRAGNTRKKAAKKVGMRMIPIVKHTFPSESAAIAFALSDNKASEMAEWDEEVLTKLLDVGNLTPTGFTEEEYHGIMLEPDLVRIDKINAANTGLKDKIIVMVLDAAKKDEVKEMLEKWIIFKKLKGIEVK